MTDWEKKIKKLNTKISDTEDIAEIIQQEGKATVKHVNELISGIQS